MARHEIPEGYTVGLLASMPRSGTWYSFYFFEFLDLYLTERSTVRTRLDVEVYHGLRLGKISVHCICPGFPDLCRGPLREKWDALSFVVDGYNYGYPKFIADNLGVFSPDLNPAIRIIYLYRNPLDQAVSYFRHARHNQDRDRIMRREADGAAVEMATASEFLRCAGLDSYIKQYLTFAALAPVYPRNILMIGYEDLIRSPESTFERMLSFWHFDINSAAKRTCVAKALKSSAPDSLRNIEAALGSSLARDQVADEESHMRGGEIGKWRSVLNDSDVEFSEARLREFGLSLSAFELGELAE